MKRTLVFLIVFVLCASSLANKVRVKDIARFQTENTIPLLGYGLVVGLEGTGDSKSTRFTIQTLANMMERMGVTVDPNQVKVKNVAAVIVTAELAPYMSYGSRIDVMVSSIGDASSLQGGTLLYTPLADASGTVFALAQGPVSIGGFNVSTGMGDQFRNNYTLVGRIPGGATVEKQIVTQPPSSSVMLHLESPDFTTADRLARVINEKIAGVTAIASSEADVEIIIPKSKQDPGEMVKLFAQIEKLEIEPDVPARVAINEKTGTIVAGQNVTISAVMLAHGNLNIEIRTTPMVSQPAPFSQGRTVLTRDAEIAVEPEVARIIHIEQQANIGDLAAALNEIGATPRDIIAVFQALKAIGALRAELVVM